MLIELVCCVKATSISGVCIGMGLANQFHLTSCGIIVILSRAPAGLSLINNELL